MEEPITVTITREHHIPGARQAARQLAQASGFSEIGIGHLTTAVSELASNLYFHTSNGGSLIFTVIEAREKIGIQVVSEDNGPGIKDVSLAMQEGYSTRGSLGGGLPGVQRLMDEFEIASVVGEGTRIVATKWTL